MQLFIEREPISFHLWEIVAFKFDYFVPDWMSLFNIKMFERWMELCAEALMHTFLRYLLS